MSLLLGGFVTPSARAVTPRQKKVAMTLSLTGAAAGLYFMDQPMRRPAGNGEYAGSPGLFVGRNSVADRLGQPMTQFGIAGAFYAGGLFGDDEKARRIGAVGAAALAVNGMATWGIKSTAGRSRPFVDDGPRRWTAGKGHENQSFPSGHTSMAFTMAAVVAEEYENPWVDGTAYGLAAAVGASRIHQDQHWLSDVAAGAGLGLLVGKGVSRWERSAGWARFMYTDGRGLYFRYSF